MSFLGGSINSQTLNGIESITDGYITIQDGTISNLQELSIGGDVTVGTNLYVGGKITCAYTASLNTDVPNKLYVDLGLSSLNTSQFLKLDGSTPMTGGLIMGGNYINGLPTALNPSDATNKSYVDAGDAAVVTQMQNADALRLLKSGDTMTGTLNMTGNTILNLSTTTLATSAVNKAQMDTADAVVVTQMQNADALRLLKSGDTMTGNLNMSGNNIININNLASASSTYLHLLLGTTIIMQLTPEQVIFKTPILINNIAVGGTGIYMAGTKIANLSDGTNPQDVVNKSQMDTEDNKRLRLDGSSAMTGNINCNGNNITNIGSIQSQIGSDLNLQIGTTNVLQLQPAQASLSLLLNMNSNSITNAPSIGAGTSVSLKVATLTVMQIQAEKVLMSKPIDMNSKLINLLANGVLPTDAINKGQMDNADLLKMDKANGVGTGMMTLSNTYSQLKLVNTNTSTGGNLIIQNNLGATIDFWDTSSYSIAAISTNSTEKTLILSAGTLIKIIKPTQITGTLTMVSGGLSPIDMSGNDITKVSNINSNGTNALNLQYNSTTKVKIDSSGLTMQNSGNLDMNNGTISNTTLTTPKITAPIQTTTSSSYSTINNSYLNIGYTVSNSYNIYIPMTQTTYYPLLAANNRITVDPGVWIITCSFNPFCISGTPNSQAIQMIVSNVNSATEWTAYPSSKVRQILNGNYDSNDSGYIVNTFVITLTTQTYLYLWGYVQYTGTSVAWAYDFAELRATRIA